MQVRSAELYPVTHRHLCMDQSVFPEVWSVDIQGLLYCLGTLEGVIENGLWCARRAK